MIERNYRTNNNNRLKAISASVALGLIGGCSGGDTPVTLPSTKMFEVRSIESMNQTKDRVCSQPSTEFIDDWTQKAFDSGATHITIATPYDSPPCADSGDYVRRWESSARSAGLNIWWRQMFLEFEGIYDANKTPQCNTTLQTRCNDYIQKTYDYIVANADLYKDGDVFSITAEPAASRIRGVNCFDETCIFESETGSWNAIPEFNDWLRDSMESAHKAFQKLGLNIDVNAGGMDGFVTIGYDNPDWGCDSVGKPHILYPETVLAMGGFVSDHYTDNMKSYITAINKCYPPDKYPNLKFVTGEWGPIFGTDTTAQIHNTLSALNEAGERFTWGINYWQGGPAGQESIFTNNGRTLDVTSNYDALKDEYTR